MRKIITSLKQGSIIFCIVFSITTIISSSLQLYQGQTTDTNLHILNRAIIVLIGVTTMTLYYKFKSKNKVFTYLIPYAISMGIVFLYIWIIGFFEPLHPNAYRDIFLNFTGITILVILTIALKKKLTKRQKKGYKSKPLTKK